MSSSNFLIDPCSTLVVDASVVINLNATGRARDIIAGVPNPWAVTENALTELANGMRNGHDDAHELQGLIDGGFVGLVSLGDTGGSVYEGLVDGSALRTLDDGEAATIGYACQVRGIAVIDERKARRLCADRFPKLAVASTVDLLLHEKIVSALGKKGQVEGIVSALRLARMRVPPEHLARIVALIGEKCAASCPSLPKAARVGS